ncbi:MAG: hypothetical protein KAS77_01285 [Thermoplasmata archaeon]|nr:hypothetical protein [Thermoplasmata archaeon]
MAEHKETLKKKVMKTFWRVQQAQMVISVVFWSMTLTGIFYPMIVEKLKDYPWWGENTFLGLMVFFLIVLGGIFLFGFFYDKFKFWKEQQLVIVERNPYTGWKMNPVFTQWVDLWIEMAKTIPDKTPELEAKIKFFESWVARLEEIDPWTKEMREMTRAFALEGDDTVLRTIAKKD